MDYFDWVVVAMFLVVAIYIVILILARMKGKIDIYLDKYTYSAGEDITGKVVLNLRKPVDANEISVSLVAYEEKQSTSTSSLSPRKVFNCKYSLDGKKSFSAGQYEYSFKITTSPNMRPPERSIVGEVVHVAKVLTYQQKQVNWYILANLDAPGIDLSNKMQVNIF